MGLPHPRTSTPSRTRSAPSELKVLGRAGAFSFLRPLGSGGMGRVWLARFDGLGGFGRLVAVKRLHPAFAHDAESVAMLLDEARLSATVNHANVLGIEQVLEVEGEFFLVMPYVSGGTLADVEARGPLPTTIALAIASDVLAGLEAVHTATGLDGKPLGIVHRDISADNVLLGRDGLARLADFGVASSRDGLAAPTGVRGKHAYMPPEQLQNEDVDARADVFAAATMLWRTLTGVPAFGDAGSRRPLTKRLDAIRRGPAGTPLDAGGLEALVVLRRALAFDKVDRTPSARRLLDELRQCGPVALRDEVASWLAARLESPLEPHVGALVSFAPSDDPTVVTPPPPSGMRRRSSRASSSSIHRACARPALANRS